MNWRFVPIPEKMKGLAKDHRGFPVPYIVMVDPKIGPVFTVNDQVKVLKATWQRLCGICGQPLEEDQWALGGALSAFHPQGAYIDSPLHHECGTYALQVCPYLAMSSYRGAVDLMALSERFAGTVILQDPTQSRDRPSFFAFVKVKGWVRNANGYVVVDRPFLAVEYWIGGKKKTQQEAKEHVLENGQEWHPFYPQE